MQELKHIAVKVPRDIHERLKAISLAARMPVCTLVEHMVLYSLGIIPCPWWAYLYPTAKNQISQNQDLTNHTS